METFVAIIWSSPAFFTHNWIQKKLLKLQLLVLELPKVVAHSGEYGTFEYEISPFLVI